MRIFGWYDQRYTETTDFYVVRNSRGVWQLTTFAEKEAAALTLRSPGNFYTHYIVVALEHKELNINQNISN